MGHLRHAAILASLHLLHLAVIRLLLLGSHVGPGLGCSLHVVLWYRHWWWLIRSLVVNTVDVAIFAASRFRCVEARLDQVLAFCFGDQWLKFGRGERVD